MRLLSAVLLLVSVRAEAAFIAPVVRWRPQAVVTGAPGSAFSLAVPDERTAVPSAPLTSAVWGLPQTVSAELRPLRLDAAVTNVTASAPLDPAPWAEVFDGPPSKSEAASFLRIEDFLKGQETIRVFMGDAPGNGHQSASATVMKRLRQLGYKGRFEVVYQAAVRPKLSTLLPGFNPWAGGHQTIESLGVTTIPWDYFKRSAKARVALAVTGGDDYENPGADRLGVDYSLVLQPQDWPEEATLQAGDGERVELPELSELGYIYRVPERADVAGFLREETAHDKALAAKVPGLVEVFSHEEHHLLPAYGLGFKGVKKLARLVRALGSVRHELGGKGVVIPVVSNLDEREVARLKARLTEPSGRRSFLGWLTRTQRKTGGEDGPARVKILSIRDAGLRDALANLGAGEVLVVLTGSVTQNVFEHLFSRATLPATVAGKNAMNLMQLMGKTFLNTVDDYPFLLDSPLKPEERRLIRDAQGYLTGGLRGSLQALAAFIVQASDPGSAISRFYASLSPRDAPIAKDKLAQGLLRVIELVDKKRL